MKNDHDHNRNQSRNQIHRPQSKVRKYYLYIYFLWLLFIYHCYICAFTITIYISYMFSWLYIYIYFIYISFLYSIYFYYYLHIIDPKRRRRRGGFKRVFGMSLKRDRTTHYCLQHAIFNLHHPLLKQYTVKQINTFDILHHPFKPNSISNPYLDTNINEFNIALKHDKLKLFNVTPEFVHVKGGPEKAVLTVQSDRYIIIKLRIQWSTFNHPDLHYLSYRNRILADDDQTMPDLVIEPNDYSSTKKARNVFTAIAPRAKFVRVMSVYELKQI